MNKGIIRFTPIGFQFSVSLLITAGSFAAIYRYKPEQAVSFLLGQKHDDKPLDNSPRAEKEIKETSQWTCKDVQDSPA